MKLRSVSLKQAGTKTRLATMFINMRKGKCTVDDYKAFIKTDSSYRGAVGGCEFYVAAKEWRSDRGLPPIKRVSKKRGMEPLSVNHGLVVDDVSLKEVKKESPQKSIKKNNKENAWKKELVWAILDGAVEAKIRKDKAGRLWVEAAFGPDKG